MTREQMQERLEFLVAEFRQYDFLLKANFPDEAAQKAFREQHAGDLAAAKAIKEEMIRLRWALLSPEDQETARRMTRPPGTGA